VRPAPRRWLTIALSVLLALGGLGLLVAAQLSNHLDELEHPVATAVRVFERDQALDDALNLAPPWERFWLLVDLGSSNEGTSSQAIRAYRELRGRLELNEYTPGTREQADQLLTRLAILEAEAGNHAEAAKHASQLPQISGRLATLPPAIRYAYNLALSPSSPPPLDLEALRSADEPLLAPGRTGDLLARRSNERSGDQAQAAAASARLAAEQREVEQAALLLGLGNLPIVAGLVLGLWLLVRRRNLPQLADGLRVPPWSFGLGYAIFARAAFACAVVAIVYYVLWRGVGPGNPLMVTLVAAQPLLWLLRRDLLAPAGLRLASAFGLLVPARRWLPLLLATLVLIGIEQTLGTLSGLLASALGYEAPWTESVTEEVIWSAWPRAAALFVDGVVWAPLFEELAFRGLLYTTLRSRLAPLAAAAITAALFAGLHLYSAIGFATLFLGAVASALVYERTRSLLPSILAHSFNNVLAIGASLALYR
jgi:uncharacterized protein